MANSPSDSDQIKSKLAFNFTLRTMLVLLTVTAVSAACFGGLVNAANQEMSNVLLFIPLMAAAPLALMVLVNYLLMLSDWISRRKRRSHRKTRED